MALDFTDSAGNLFNRLGILIGALNQVNTFRSTTFDTRITSITDEYLTSLDLTEGLFTQVDAYRPVHGSFLQYLRSLAQDTLIEMVNDDAVLVTKDLSTAMKELVRQMVAQSVSVDASAPTVSVSAGGSNTGTGVLVASVKGTDGKNLEYVIPEVAEVTITTDAQVTGTAGLETASIRGEAVQSDPLSWDWPKGSGVATSVTAISASVNASTNFLYNSSFDTFTVANTPDNWTLVTGAAGTDFLSSGSGPALKGSNALQLVGNGATLHHLTQTFNNSGGTTVKLSPLTVYAVNVFVKGDTSNGATIQFSLVDGSGTVINDAQGTANTISASSITTSYTAYNGYFRTPAALPTTIKFRIKASVAVANTKNVYIDHLAMCVPVRMYVGGPYLALFSGGTEFIKDDTWSVTVANTWGDFQKGFERFFGMKSLGYQLRSDAGGTETILDSLVA